MLQTSYEAKTKDLWVFIETKDGKARNVGLELLNPGRRLAGTDQLHAGRYLSGSHYHRSEYRR